MLNNVRLFGFVSSLPRITAMLKAVCIIHEDMSFITASLCCPRISRSLSQPLTFLKNFVIVSVPDSSLVSSQCLPQASS